MTKALDHRTVLTEITKASATEAQIATALGVPGANRELDRLRIRGQQLHHLLARLVCGGLANMQVQDREWLYRPTARAKRMADATDEQLSAWITSRLTSASALPGGGAR